MGKNWDTVVSPLYPCSYKPGEIAQIFAITTNARSGSASPLNRGRPLYNALLPLGFDVGPAVSAYVPDCPDCHDCVPLRIRVADYKFSSSERALINRNADLKVDVRYGSAELDHFLLFGKYLEKRHPGQKLREQNLNDFIEEARNHSHLLDIRDSEGKLVASTTIDMIDNAFGLYSVIYDPECSTSDRSLGTHTILMSVLYAKKSGLQHVYLGNWVKDGIAMDYKKRFHNLEAFTENGWVDFNPAVHTEGPSLQKIIPIIPIR